MDDIVILAGGECPADLAALSGVPRRSDIPFNGKTFLETVVEAVKPLGEPLIVGGDPAKHPRTIPSGTSFVDSLSLALAELKSDRFLLATADLPFLTPEAVALFLRSADQSADVNYPIVPMDACKKAFPTLKRTAVKIREGEFTGGNLAFLKTDAARNSLPILRKLYEDRKSPLKLARTMGLKTLALLVRAQIAPASVSIADFEASLSRVLQLKIKGVVVPDPGIGTDIDNAEQYQAILRLQNP